MTDVGELPSITVITVTLNRASLLRKSLGSVIAQSYPKELLEILVVDGGSTDGSQDIAREFGARVIEAPEFRDDQEPRRALAVNHAKNSILAYVDSDNVLSQRDWLRRMVQPLVDDQRVAASQTLRYEYRPADSALDRYCALFGGPDPVSYYLGKNDRISWATDNWKQGGRIVAQKSDYFVVEFDGSDMPTVGCNGFLVRRSVLKAVNCPPEEFFHTDVMVDACRIGFRRHAVVDVPILHLTGYAGLGRLLQKRFQYMIRHSGRSSRRRRFLVFDPGRARDWTKLVFFHVYALTVIKPLWDAFNGYRRIRDVAWFVHPVMCVAMLFVYAIGTVVAIANRWRASS